MLGLSSTILHFSNRSGISRGRPIAQKTVTPLGNAQISTTQSVFGGASGYLDGTDDMLTIPNNADFNFSSGNWCVEFRLRIATAAPRHVIAKLQNGAPYAGWYLYYDSAASKLKLYTDNNALRITQSTTLAINTWAAVAIERSGTTVTLYINGSSVGTWTGALQEYDTPLTIGGSSVPTNETNAYFDEFRISNIARYSGNYTAAVSEFAADANTTLLLHMNGTNGSTTFTDSMT